MSDNDRKIMIEFANLLPQVLEVWDRSTIGRALGVVVAQAESAATVEVGDDRAVSLSDDVSLGKSKAAEYCDMSLPTFTKFIETWDIPFSGEGRGQKFRISELHRAKLAAEAAKKGK